MEHLVSFLSLRDRKAFASVCQTFNSIHKEAPFASANVTSRNKDFACRARKLLVDEYIGVLESPSCHELLIWDIIGDPVVHQLYVPNVKIVRYSGNLTQFAQLCLPRRLDILDVHAYEPCQESARFSFSVKTLKTLTLACFLQTKADRYEITTGDYESFKHRLPRDATICFHGNLCFTNLTTILHKHIEVHGCNLQRIQFCRPLESLMLRQCNAITSDLPCLQNIRHLDLMDNDTLQEGPVVHNLVSINLLHTGIRNQVQYALESIGDACTYVGLTITSADIHFLPMLFQKRIDLLELCCEKTIELPKSTTVGEIRMHTSHYFTRSFSCRHCSYFVWKRTCS